MVSTVRAAVVCLGLVTSAETASASPVARLEVDADGDGAPDHLELDSSGVLKIESKGKAATVTIAPSIARGTLTVSAVLGRMMVLVDATTPAGNEAIVLEAPGWKEVIRTMVGGVGLDSDYSTELDLTSIGVFRYQSRAGIRRCDGKPAHLFAEGYDGFRFRKLSRIPSDVDDKAPQLAAHLDPAGASVPLLFQARAASHQPGASDAGALAIPAELDDGKPTTIWREDFAASAGEGQFFTFEPRFEAAKATQLRIVPGNPTSATTMKAFNRPKRVAVVWTGGAAHVDLPDAASDPLGSAYVVDLPAPVTGCVTVILEETYGPPSGTTAIGELEVFADGERTGGGEAALAHVIADGTPGAQTAAVALAKRGAAGVAAIEAELGKTNDHATRARLVTALLPIRDPSAGVVLARAASQDWVFGRDLLAVIAALGGLGQTQALHELAAKHDLDVEVRIAAVRALAASNPADRDALLDLAGGGPRALRRAVIDMLSAVSASLLIKAATDQTSPPAAGDLWRAATRRAHNAPDERAGTLAAMTAALATATDYERRYRLIDGIAALGDGAALQALAAMLHALPATPETAAFAQIAAQELGVNPRPEALELITTLARDLDPGVRLAALAALANADAGVAGPWHAAEGPDAIDRVIVTMLSTDAWPEVRQRAAQVLGKRCDRIGPARALADAVARDHEVGVRGDALGALVECHAADAGPLLARTWDDGKAPVQLRQRAIDLSVTLGDPALAARLIGKLRAWRGGALESADALALVQNAAYALGRLAPAGAADALLDALDDGAFPEIVGAAATSLGLLGPACPASAKTRLKELSHSDDNQIAIAAKRAYTQCGK
jgi:hypothetical protein